MTTQAGEVIANITISADGYVAGLNQTEERPFGDDGSDGSGDRLHSWMFDNPDENRAEVDELAAYRAVIMGRNMFSPVRGEWDRQQVKSRATSTVTHLTYRVPAASKGL